MNDTASGMSGCNLTGTYYHAVDAKGRINFPAKLREQLGETFWLSKGITDRFLTVYSQEGWEDLMRQIGSLRGPDGERMRRRICAGAAEVTPDKQGRILIPVPLREYAGLETDSEIVVAGAGRKAEIWTKALWMQEEDSFDPMAAAVLNDLCL